MRLKITLIYALLLLAGCSAVGPDYQSPETAHIPAAWNQQLHYKDVTNNDLADWWTKLGDPTLNNLIQKADSKNLDLRIAFARIKEARAVIGVSRSAFLPDIDAVGDRQTTKLSKELADSVPSPQKRIDDFESLGTQAAWEIDLFGRVRRSVEAATADYQASIEDYRDVMVILYTDITTNYVTLRTLQTRKVLAEENARAQRETLKIVKGRFDAELTSELDYRQAQRNLAITESLIPQLTTGIDSARYRLAVLIGQTPGSLTGILSAPQPIPTIQNEVLASIPRDMIRQRPDIRRAERQLASQTAQIGIAIADLYPRLSLSGAFAFQAASGSLLNSSAQGWSFGPTLVWNVFSGGRVQSNIEIEKAQTEAARAFYERTVLSAMAETESALSAYINENKRLGYLEKSVEASEKSVQLAQISYKAGLTDFQNVLDAERSLFEQQDIAAQSQGNKINSFIQIYRAIGGGWQGKEIVTTQSNTEEQENKNAQN